MRELPFSVWKARRISRQVAQVVGHGGQPAQRLVGAVDHLARFLEEDLAHLVVVFEPGAATARAAAAPA